jgi:hypothetical protein
MQFSSHHYICISGGEKMEAQVFRKPSYQKDFSYDIVLIEHVPNKKKCEIHSTNL